MMEGKGPGFEISFVKVVRFPEAQLKKSSYSPHLRVLRHQLQKVIELLRRLVRAIGSLKWGLSCDCERRRRGNFSEL